MKKIIIFLSFFSILMGFYTYDVSAAGLADGKVMYRAHYQSLTEKLDETTLLTDGYLSTSVPIGRHDAYVLEFDSPKSINGFYYYRTGVIQSYTIYFYDLNWTQVGTTQSFPPSAYRSISTVSNVKYVVIRPFNTSDFQQYLHEFNVYSADDVFVEPYPEDVIPGEPTPEPTDPPEPTPTPEPTPEPTPTPPPPLTVGYQPNKTAIVVNISGGQAPYTVSWSHDGEQLGSITTSNSSYRIEGLLPNTNYVISVIDADSDVVVDVVNTGNFEGFIPPSFPSPGELFQKMIDNFGVAGSIAIAVITAAVALGLIVILGLWGWRLTKKWLNAAK